MERSRIGFFRKVFYAITDFRLYPFIIKERTISAIGYFIKLVLISCAVLSVYFMILTSEFISEDLNSFMKKIPNFSVANGEVTFEEEKTIEANDFVTLVLKNDYANNVNFSDYDDEKVYILVTKDYLRVGNVNNTEMAPAVSFEDVSLYDKAQMIDNINEFNNSFEAKAMLYLMVVTFTFFYFLVRRTWLLLMYIFVLLIFDGLFYLKLRFRDYFKISIYISTLPLILEMLAIAIGGKYSSTADFISFLIAGIYAFYALRAIRLNTLVMKGAGNTPEEKIMNAINDAKEEIEKQLKDIEEKGEAEDKKEEQSKDDDNTKS